MASPGFSVEALSELSGLAVAAAVFDAFPPVTHPRVLAVIGPGGNGGDALVAARHLAGMGYSDVAIYYPRRRDTPLFVGLLASAEMMGAAPIEALPPPSSADLWRVVVDGLFGFSFRPPVRPGVLADAIDWMAAEPNVVAVDVPSGWDVDVIGGGGGSLRPAALVSLMAPKRCARGLSRRAAHFLGRVMLPPALALTHGLAQQPFDGAKQIVRLPEWS